jgi:hypothetical protein
VIVRHLQLSCSAFWVDVRLTHFGRRWLASADTPAGPTLGVGHQPLEALMAALDPFDTMVDELLRSTPEELFWATS